jgi:hypothetical protein
MPRRRPWTALALLAFALPAGALDDALYAEVLSRYTHEVRDLARTRVAYRELGSAPEWRRVVESLEATDPSRLGTRKAKLAFWIDAYNVLAIDLIVRNHPLESIRDLGSLIWPVWKRTAGTIGGESYSLDRIEHEIIRPMGDPRTHAAVICASTSCPALRREPWRADRLDEQLDDAMRTWLADPGKGLLVDRKSGVVTLSRIFDWFEEDFEAAGGVLAVAARYAPLPEGDWLSSHPRPRLRYFDYDWRVNDLESPQTRR